MYSGEAVETGTVGEVFDQMRHPYTRGLFNSIPLPGADKNARPLVPIPRPAAAAARAAAGLLVRAALRLFRARRSATHGRSPMETVDRRRRPCAPAAGASRDRLGGRQAARARAAEPAPLGPVGARGRPTEEILRDRATARCWRCSSGTRAAHGQGQRAARLRRPRGARPWRSSASPAAASRPSPR